ncbi:MAG TPA: hypothetical protein VNA20_07090 [Frankiaceae bacterium]|nr:hypothetical protein [Frankiaceae bacterium]
MPDDLDGLPVAYDPARPDDADTGVPTTWVLPVHGIHGDSSRVRLGEALVEAGVITPTQLEQCLRVQESETPRRRLGLLVVELGLALDVDVAQGLSSILGFDYVDPATLDVPLAVVQRVPKSVVELLGVVPIGAGPTWLRVAVADPTDRNTVETLRELTGLLNISMAVATPESIATAIRRFWSPDYAPSDDGLAPVAAAGDAAETTAEAAAEAETTAETTAEAEAEPAEGGWEYAFVGDGLPEGHPGRTSDILATERDLARLGALGWEAVGVSTSDARMTVLLKRARPAAGS